MVNSKIGGVVKTTPPKSVRGFVWADQRRCDWFNVLSPESQSILDSLMPPPPAPRTSSPAGVGVPVGNVSRSPVPAVQGPVQARPTQGGKQPRRRPPPPPRPRRGGVGGGGGDDGDDSGGPSNGSDTPRSRRSGVPSDRGDLQDTR